MVLFFSHSISCHFDHMCFFKHVECLKRDSGAVWCKTAIVIYGSAVFEESKTNMFFRPRLCCFPSTSAWPSCRSRIPIPFSDWSRV